MTRSADTPVVVGWREVVGLPDWGVPAVKAKVDTGARTSAIHVSSVEELSDDRIRFEVVVREKPVLETRVVEAVPVRRAVVKPSHGATQERWVCRTRMKLGPIEREIELSLVSRRGMLCRMLICRRSLPEGTVVDPNRRYVHGGVRVKPRAGKAKER